MTQVFHSIRGIVMQNSLMVGECGLPDFIMFAIDQ